MNTGKRSKSRRSAILLHLQHNGRAMVDDMADMLDTTPQTIRKDLNALSADGRVMRFHGGAALLAGSEYTGFEARKEIAREEKERIGQATADLIPNNAAIAINAGTTTAAVARHLAGHAGLKALVDSVSVANEIKGFGGVELIVPGGQVRKSDGAILGEAAIDFIRMYRTDLAVVGAAAIAPDGTLLDYDLREAAMARAIISNARHVILAADSTKFERAAPVCIGHLSQMHALVTDRRCPPSLRDLCIAHDVDLTLAG